MSASTWSKTRRGARAVCDALGIETPTRRRPELERRRRSRTWPRGTIREPSPRPPTHGLELSPDRATSAPARLALSRRVDSQPARGGGVHASTPARPERRVMVTGGARLASAANPVRRLWRTASRSKPGRPAAPAASRKWRRGPTATSRPLDRWRERARARRARRNGLPPGAMARPRGSGSADPHPRDELAASSAWGVQRRGRSRGGREPGLPGCLKDHAPGRRASRPTATTRQQGGGHPLCRDAAESEGVRTHTPPYPPMGPTGPARPDPGLIVNGPARQAAAARDPVVARASSTSTTSWTPTCSRRPPRQSGAVYNVAPECDLIRERSRSPARPGHRGGHAGHDGAPGLGYASGSATRRSPPRSGWRPQRTFERARTHGAWLARIGLALRRNGPRQHAGAAPRNRTIRCVAPRTANLPHRLAHGAAEACRGRRGGGPLGGAAERERRRRLRLRDRRRHPDLSALFLWLATRHVDWAQRLPPWGTRPSDGSSSAPWPETTIWPPRRRRRDRRDVDNPPSTLAFAEAITCRSPQQLLPPAPGAAAGLLAHSRRSRAAGGGDAACVDRSADVLVLVTVVAAAFPSSPPAWPHCAPLSAAQWPCC